MFPYGQSNLFHTNQNVLKTKPKCYERTSLPNFIKRIKESWKVHKGMSLNISIPASITLEAALIFPLFLFFFINLIWMVEVIGIHSEVEQKMYEIGDQMIAYSYPYKKLKNKLLSVEENELVKLFESISWSNLYIKQQIETLDTASRLTDVVATMRNSNGDIFFKVSYEIQPPFPLPGFESIRLVNSFYSKSYIGFTDRYKEEEEDTTYVYVTRTGDVYHTNRNCVHLKLNVLQVLSSSISTYRNKDGSKYYACEICKDEPKGQYVFISEYGTRYHTKRSCPAFQLTVYEIPISLIGERRKCLSCQ